MYTRSPADGSLRQGEILTNLVQVSIDLATVSSAPEARRINEVTHPWAIVMSQDCDLDLDYTDRQQLNCPEHKKIPSVLFCEMITAQALFGRSDINSASRWNRIKTNQEERYQFLERVLPENDALGTGLPELGIDFKRFFTIPRDEVYRRIELNQAIKRCRLESPYLESVARRFSNYLSRIALPVPITSEPVTRE